MTLSTVAHETFVIERTYDVPVAQTFRAWADPLLKARWFAGSAEALGAGYELDFRVGGREVNRGGPPGGPVYTYKSEFRDIVPEQRIVYTYEMYADEVRISVSVATVAVQRPRCDDATGPHGAGGVPRRPRHGGSAGGGNPVPSGLACRHLERVTDREETRGVPHLSERSSRRPASADLQPVSTANSPSKEFLNVTSSSSQLCCFARRLQHR